MDDDRLRRGKPTNHTVFGEAMALMAGMGLYSLSFDIVLRYDGYSAETLREGMQVLVSASGRDGIVGGQVLDLANNGARKLTETEVAEIHKKKTSAMFEAAAVLGCIAAGAGKAQRQNAVHFAENVGLAFQIRDDILDVSGDSSSLGKTTGKDRVENKTTFADILGIENAQKDVESYSQKALAYLKGFSDSDFLQYITGFLCGRKY